MSIAQFAALALGLIITESLVLVRLPGADPFFGISADPRSASSAGMGVALAIVLGTVTLWPFGRLLASPGLAPLRTLVFLFILAAISSLFEYLAEKLPSRFRVLLGVHPKSLVVNSAVMGVALTSVGTGFFAAVSSAVAAGVGFWLIAVIFASVRERVSLTSGCPASMDGLPIALVTAGLLALVFTGFQGIAIR